MAKGSRAPVGRGAMAAAACEFCTRMTVRRALLIARPLRQTQCVLRHPRARGRRAVARAIGFTRGLDPQKRVDEPVSGLRRGARTQGASIGIAPLIIGRRAEAVATRGNDEMLATGE